MCYGVGEWPPKLSPEAFDVDSRFVLDCWDLPAHSELADFHAAVFLLLSSTLLEATQNTRTPIIPMSTAASPPAQSGSAQSIADGHDSSSRTLRQFPDAVG